ncbi:MAG TPA: hypothetical protein VGC41_14875 [Kofleriaceae bacterium]
MPRFGLLLIVGLSNGCWFDPHYQSGRETCADGVCPSGLACVNEVCVTPGDGSTPHDAPKDSTHDSGPPPALTCADPGTFVADATVTGTTAGRSNTVEATCALSTMFGADAVYKINATVGQHVTLTPHSAAYPITAYLIAPCTTAPATPACTGNAYATDTTPVTITIPATTDYFIVVDGNNAGLSGAYSLTIAIQ